MALRRSLMLAAISAALVAAPTAWADTPLPGVRTHVDPAGVTTQPSSPELTLIDPDTDAGDVRRGYLYVRLRCNQRCDVDVTAAARINGKWRDVGTASKTLPANKVRRVKVKIRSDVARRIAAGAKYRFTVLPFPPSDG
jgi:hypothetical protein